MSARSSSFQDSKSVFMIIDFPNVFETAELWYFVGLTAILR